MRVKVVCLNLSVWIKIFIFVIQFPYSFTLWTQFLLGNYSIYLSDIYSEMHKYFNTVMDKLQ
jgi:hypothetical protein